VIHGLPNLGRTCFFSATIQCLFHVDALHSYFAGDSVVRDLKLMNADGKAKRAAEAYREFQRQVDGGANDRRVVGQAFRKLAGHFGVDTSNDMVEMLHTLLGNLDRDLNVATSPGRIPHIPGIDEAARCWNSFTAQHLSVICDLFRWQSWSAYICETCGAVGAYFDYPWVRTFPLLDESIPEIGLLDCLGSITRGVTCDNKSCSACSRFPVRFADVIVRPPSVFIFHLQRFGADGSKNHQHVDFPDGIDISPYICGSPPAGTFVYELTSVAEHLGETASDGHYRCFLRFGAEWFCCDDGEVTPLTPEEVHGSQAYVLFYERK
jgi:ubiquitin C-terminal hydrolase